MIDTSPVRMRKALDRLAPPPAPPAGISLLPLWRSNPATLHQLLQLAYAQGGGSVGDFDHWFWPLVQDEEFDPALVLIAADTNGALVGLAQCWTSGFLKDLVVHPDWHGRGIGGWLLCLTFHRFAERGQPYLDLKVQAGNTRARRLYASHGMVEVV